MLQHRSSEMNAAWKKHIVKNGKLQAKTNKKILLQNLISHSDQAAKEPWIENQNAFNNR
jgi:hypothetical protein